MFHLLVPGGKIASQIYGGTILNVPGDRNTMTFSGSPLTLSNGNFKRVPLINSAGNTITMSDGETDFSIFCTIQNNGTINWSENGIWELSESTFNNSGTLNASPTSAGSIRPGTVFKGTFNNLAGGVINVTGAGTECIIANAANGNGGVIELAFSNAGNMNFDDGSTTTFETSQISQSAGDTELSDNSVVNFQAFDVNQTFNVTGGTVGGVGSIIGNLQVGQATIRPGTTSAGGALYVDGDVTMGPQTQTSIIIIPANNANGELITGGTATLAGTLTLRILSCVLRVQGLTHALSLHGGARRIKSS